MKAKKVIEKFELSSSQKKILSECVKRAHHALYLDGQHRLIIAEIAIELNNKVLPGEPLNSTSSKLLRSMFAKDLGFNLKVIDNWIQVKLKVIDKIPKEVAVKHSYTSLLETSTLMQKKKIGVEEALAEVSAEQSDSAKRKKLLLRYSNEILSCATKYRGRKCESINEVIHRLSQALKTLKELK